MSDNSFTFNIPPGDLDIIRHEVREKIYDFNLTKPVDEWKSVAVDKYDVHYTNLDSGDLEVIVYPIENGQTVTHKWHNLDLSTPPFGTGSKPEVKLTEKLTDEERLPDLSYVKKGDRVWDSWLRKWELVHEVSEEKGVIVLGGMFSWVRLDGRAKYDQPPRYYPNEFEIPDEAFAQPLPDLAVDTPVWVRSEGRWYPRHFAAWRGREMGVWNNGYTRHTEIGNYKVYYQTWSLTKPEEETK
jgi:hypothetical protein